MGRGEIWWANVPHPAGRRPVLVLSRDSMPATRGEITVAYLTSTWRHTDVEVLVTPADGVPRQSVVNRDSINTISKSGFDRFICKLSDAKMVEVKEALLKALGFKN